MYPRNRIALVPLQLPLLTFVFGILSVVCMMLYTISVHWMSQRNVSGLFEVKAFYSNSICEFLGIYKCIGNGSVACLPSSCIHMLKFNTKCYL